MSSATLTSYYQGRVASTVESWRLECRAEAPAHLVLVRALFLVCGQLPSYRGRAGELQEAQNGSTCSHTPLSHNLRDFVLLHHSLSPATVSMGMASEEERGGGGGMRNPVRCKDTTRILFLSLKHRHSITGWLSPRRAESWFITLSPYLDEATQGGSTQPVNGPSGPQSQATPEFMSFRALFPSPLCSLFMGSAPPPPTAYHSASSSL